MRTTINILTLMLIFIFSSSLAFHSDKLCDLIKASTTLAKGRLTFHPQKYSNFKTDNLIRVDQSNFEFLMQRNMVSTDRMYLIGHFAITTNRVGLVCYNETIECDNKVSFVSLHIIDSCKKLIDTKFISSDDSYPFIYRWSSDVTSGKDSLIMKLEQTSEWVMGIDTNIDTLFTDTYIFNLKSSSIDTLSINKTFKPFIHDTRK